MTCTTTSRPRMAAIYAPGTVRARRWHGDGDVRGYRPPSRWSARADLTDIHPITGLGLFCPGVDAKTGARQPPRPDSTPNGRSNDKASRC